MRTRAATLVLCIIAAAAFADDRDSKWEKAYPPAEKGQVRHVLHLPEQKDEQAMKVELIVGQTIDTDGVNHTSFGGSITEENIQGWGYPRYVARAEARMSTLIGVDPNKPMVKTFVTIGGGPHLVRYNSRLPIVVYAPEGFEVRYRFWKADPEAKPIEKG
ncbi:MAG: ecotin family protein [Verrucomicrobiota bacterium]